MAGTIVLPSLHRRSRIARGVGIGVVVLALVVGAVSAWSWWYRGGAHLTGAAGDVGGPVSLGDSYHTSLHLTSDGPVELVAARAIGLEPTTAAVGFSVEKKGIPGSFV